MFEHRDIDVTGDQEQSRDEFNRQLNDLTAVGFHGNVDAYPKENGQWRRLAHLVREVHESTTEPGETPSSPERKWTDPLRPGP